MRFPFGIQLKEVFITSLPWASHQPAPFCMGLLDTTWSYQRFYYRIVYSSYWSLSIELYSHKTKKLANITFASYHQQPVGESNPCFRRERAAS